MSAKKPAQKSPPAPVEEAIPSESALTPGSGTRRVVTRLITIYGPPKSRKTGSVAFLPMGRTKWLVSDSNCAATLTALGRMPHKNDFYEVKSLVEASDFLRQVLQVVDQKGVEALGIDYLVVDSVTQLHEWHSADVAAETNQTYLGEAKGWDSNGYQKFNATFLQFLDLLSSVAQYITVIAIGHSQDLREKQKKGVFGGLALGEKLSTALGRKSNWILLKDWRRRPDDGSAESDTLKRVDGEDGEPVLEEDVIYSAPIVEGYHACCSLPDPADQKRARWPGDLRVLLRAARLYQDEP